MIIIRDHRERLRHRHAAEQHDELTPPHLIKLHLLPSLGTRGIITDWRGSSQGLAAVRDFAALWPPPLALTAYFRNDDLKMILDLALSATQEILGTRFLSLSAIIGRD